MEKVSDSVGFGIRHISTAATLIRYACDEQLLLSVQNTLTVDEATLNMAEINDAYLSI